MIGTTKDEATLFLSADPAFGKMTEDQVRLRASMMLHDKTAVIDVYKSLRPNEPPTYWLTSAATGQSTWMDSIRLAERKLAQHAAPVFMYRLDWETPVLGGAMKSPHGLEVPLVFDNVDKKRLLLGTGPQPTQIAGAMSQAWCHFARTRSPSQPGLAWPTYDTSTRPTMIFDTKSHVVADPDAAARKIFST
jgi:para-nitrobenzyl esterase